MKPLLASVAVVLLCSGCTGGLSRTVRRPPAPLALTALVVYPVQLAGGDYPPWRAHELGQRLTAAVVEAGGDRLAVVGPTEFRVLRWEDDAAWVASDVLPFLVRSGLTADGSAVLRARVERRVASQLQEARDARGRARSAAALEETTWVVRVELLHPGSATLLAELSAQATVDPFAPPTGEEEFDPAPPMSHLLERLAGEAVAEALTHAAARPAADPSRVRLAETPAAAAALPDAEVARLDPLEAELWRQSRARYLTPTLSDAEAARVARLRAGLYVVEAPPHARIRKGDLIISVDGQPPERQVVARKRLGGLPVKVRLLRGGAELDGTVP
jgi:hypothetical protein